MAFRLELVFELRAAIDLDGPDQERKLLPQIMEEVGRLQACLVLIGFEDIEASHDIPSREPIADLFGQKLDLQRIDFDQIPRRLSPIIFGLLYGTARLLPPLPCQLGLSHVQRFDQDPPGFKFVHDPTDGRGRDLNPLSAEKHDKLVLPPARIPGPELEDLLHDPDGSPGLANMPGPPALFLQGRQVIRVEPPLPAIEGLGRDPEVAAGQPGVRVPVVLAHSAQLLGRPGEDRALPDQVPDVLGTGDQGAVSRRCL